jgi:hypothetical protein
VEGIYESAGKNETTKTSITNKVSYGLIGGFGIGYKIGKGNIVGDIRYQLALVPTNWEWIRTWGNRNRDEVGFTKRGLSLLLGYEYWF